MALNLKDISEAIRKNGYPQITGLYVREGESGRVLGACAIGQAALNLSVNPDEIAYSLDFLGNPAYKSPGFFCPKDDGYVASGLSTIVIHLNDEHLMPLEQIADYLDSLDA